MTRPWLATCTHGSLTRRETILAATRAMALRIAAGLWRGAVVRVGWE